MATGIFIAGFGSIATGLNFIVTIHKMRAPGLTWLRLPLFVWSLYTTSIILVLATPVLAITLALMALERAFGVGIFNPALGGDPLLFQHLFWFYSHPAVYIMILPGMGVVSELIPCFARKQIFGYHFVAYASVAIGVLGFLVWGHHMFVSSQSIYAGMIFSVLSFLVAIPSAIKVFNWTATLYKGSISFQTPMLYALGFIGLFTIGGLTGLFLASLAVDVHVHDTYFVIAHFHYIMVGGMVMAYLGGLHFWWPKITGRLYPRWLAQAFRADDFRSASTSRSSRNSSSAISACRGGITSTRRNFRCSTSSPPRAHPFSRSATFLPLAYLLWSLRYGRSAGPNPWRRPAWNGRPPRRRRKITSRHTPIVTDEPYRLRRAARRKRNWRRRMPDAADVPDRASIRRRGAATRSGHDGHVALSRHGDPVLRRDVSGLHRLSASPIRRLLRKRAGTR